MQADTCPSDAQLQALQQGKLTEDTLHEVTEHLRTCARCAAVSQGPHGAAAPATEEHGHGHTITPPTRVESAESLLHAPLKGLPPTPEGVSAYPFLKPPELPDEIGRLGNYRVLRLLGKGGMGFVFRAEDLTLQRPVALKVMKPEFSGEGEGSQRFLREARIMASIKHDHLVTVHQAGQDGQVVYLAMELLEGESLADYIKRAAPCSLAEILRLGREITRGLAFIHGRGLIHRDIKPANIWLEAPQGRVKILDFGLARSLQDETRLTQSGQVMGTPSFMSPEQARGQAIDARSDLFSLGCVLYCLCTGKRPFEGNSMMAVLTALAVDQPPSVRYLKPDLPPALSDLVMQLLAKDPIDRPSTADAVLARLDQIDAKPARRPQSNSATELLPPPKSRKKNQSHHLVTAAVVAGVTMLGGTVGLLLVQSSRSSTIASPAGKVESNSPEVALATVPAEPAVEVLPPPERVVPKVVKKAPEQRPQPHAPAAEKKRSEVQKVYLKDLVPVAKENWPFALPPAANGPDRRPQPPGPVPHDVVVHGRQWTRGILMHPPVAPLEGRPASLSYRLHKKFAHFEAQVCLNDGPPRSNSPLTFAVYGDGKLLWKSKPVSTQDDLQSVTVSVRNVDLLKIQVTSRQPLRE